MSSAGQANPEFNVYSGEQNFYTVSGAVKIATLFEKVIQRATELAPKLKIQPNSAIIRFHDRRHSDTVTFSYPKPRSEVLSYVSINAQNEFYFRPNLKTENWIYTPTYEREPHGDWADLILKLRLRYDDNQHQYYLHYQDPDLVEKLAEIVVYVIQDKAKRNKK